MSQQGPSAFSSDLRASSARGLGEGPAAPMKVRHPPGLYLLFVTEMWERFSYYGMRAMLVLYMVASTTDGGLGFADKKATSWYGTYTSLVYLTPLIGGFLADRFLGTHRSMVLGGLIIALGHFTLAIENEWSFLAGLGLIIIGTGFFKPCVTTMCGQLYEKGDKRRDAAFTIFYMGVNLGAFIGPLVCGYLRKAPWGGWNWGFGAAGVGMVLGLIVYLVGRPKYLKGIGVAPKQRTAEDIAARAKPLTREEKGHVASIFIMAFFVVFFWSAFEQAGSSLNLFAERRTDLALPEALKGLTKDGNAPADWFQSVNALFILIFAPIFATLWVKLGKRGKEPSTPVKMALGLILLGTGFLFMMGGAYLSDKGNPANIVRVSAFWLIAAYLMHTLGELCLSPVGLSMVSKLAPAKFAALLMGTWYLANMTANKVAGLMAGFTHDIEQGKVFKLIGGQADFYLIFFVAPVSAGLVLLAISPFIKRLMGGKA